MRRPPLSGAAGVPNFDVRRYSGVWYTQAAWGTGANSMLWYAVPRSAARETTSEQD